MNYYEHSLISNRKYGLEVDDTISIHYFLDSSKLFYPHLKHRLLLHNTFGAHLAVQKFGMVIKDIPVRDICFEHFKEDHMRVPTLNDWDNAIEYNQDSPSVKSEITDFYDCKLTRMISRSDWYSYIMKEVYQVHIAPLVTVKEILDNVKLRDIWTFTPDRNEIKWLNEHRQRRIRGNDEAS